MIMKKNQRTNGHVNAHLISWSSKAQNIQNLEIRGVFQKYAERFHRMFAIAARLMIFHIKHACYMIIKYRQNQGFWSSHVLETVA